jgi:hypothetical protein
MAPLANIILATHLSRRDGGASLSITAPNPLQDHTFITTVVGLVVGAGVFLLLLILILVLYRENSPLSRCCGRRRRATVGDVAEHKSFTSTISTPSPSAGNSRTDLAKEDGGQLADSYQNSSNNNNNSSWVDRVRHSVAIPRR